METAVEAIGEGGQVALGVFGELEGVIGAAETGLEVPQHGVDPMKGRTVFGRAGAETLGWCSTPALVTPPKQPSPSEMTRQPGSRLSLAQSAMARLVNPGTGVILAYLG